MESEGVYGIFCLCLYILDRGFIIFIRFFKVLVNFLNGEVLVWECVWKG